jgi:hypothetical protein
MARETVHNVTPAPAGHEELTLPGQSRHDEKSRIKPPPPHPLGRDGRLSPGYLHTVAPDRPGLDGETVPGEPVTFAPGELLPGWCQDLLRDGTLEIEAPNVFRLVPKPKGKR